MAKQFSVPPVVFPSSNPNPNLNPNRRPSASQSGGASGSGAGAPLPFMSFDIPSAASFSSPAVAATGNTVNSGFFEDEPPLLEELGINTRQIYRKTLSILNPLRPNSSLHQDGDLSGPFIFLLAFGLFQLLAGKFHFGIILGWVTVASLFLYIVYNMIAGRNGNLDLYRCVSLVGYCMLPMVVFSAGALFVPKGGVVVFGMGMVFVMWSTRVCTRLLVELSESEEEHWGLIGYACCLVFMLFSLLVIF